jgi:hypothetical protein
MEKTQLIIEINEVRMSAFRLQSGKLTALASANCTNRTDTGYKQTLQDLLAQCGSLDAFDAFSCAYSTPKCTLVPMSLFSESKPEVLLGLTVHQDIPRGETDYNRLPEWGIVNVYHMPLWIKSALIVKIPRIVIQHEMTHVLRYLNTGSAVPLRTHIIVQENHFCCVVRKGGAIVHASYQAYQTPEDVLYHLLYCYQHEEITSKGEIFLHASTEALAEVTKKLRSLAEKIELFKVQTMTLHLQEHLKFQLLCV